MAVSGEERHGRRLSGNAATRFYNVYDTTDEDTARDYLLATLAPTTVNSIPRVDRDCDVQELGPSIWMGVAVYRDDEGQLQDIGDSSYAFSTTGGSELHKVARYHVADYERAGVNPFLFYGLINASLNSLDGVTVKVPAFSFRETHIVSSSDVDQAYKLDLADLTATMNDDTFRGFTAGEVLFDGAEGSKRSGADWEITYAFVVSPNRYAFTVGHTPYNITVTAKLGWDYLWVSFDEGWVNNYEIKASHTAHVEQIFQDGDFDGIGI